MDVGAEEGPPQKTTVLKTLANLVGLLYFEMNYRFVRLVI